MRVLDLSEATTPARHLHEIMRLAVEWGGSVTTRLHGDDDGDVIFFVKIPECRDDFLCLGPEGKQWKGAPMTSVELTHVVAMQGRSMKLAERAKYVIEKLA